MEMHNQVNQMKKFLEQRKQRRQFEDFRTRRPRRQFASVDPGAIQHELMALNQFLEWVDTDGSMLPFKERGGTLSLKHKFESNSWI